MPYIDELLCKAVCGGFALKVTLRYRLKYLENKGLIKIQLEDGYVRYYIINNINDEQKKMFHILRQEVPRDIILYLLLGCCASQAELSRSLEKHPSTIWFHLKKLLDAGVIELAPVNNGKVNVKLGDLEIIERDPIRKEVIYRLKDPYSTYNSVILYKKRSLDDNYVDILSVNFKLFQSSSDRSITKKSMNIVDIVESFEKVLYEIFPHPYHA